MEGFHDQEALAALTEQVVDALRPLGITTEADGIQYGIQGNQMMVMIMGMVRPQARQRADQNQEDRKALNQMLAEENRQRIKSESEKIKQLAEDPDALLDFLMEGETDCEHENVHEGLCLDCQEVVTE